MGFGDFTDLAERLVLELLSLHVQVWIKQMLFRPWSSNSQSAHRLTWNHGYTDKSKNEARPSQHVVLGNEHASKSEALSGLVPISSTDATTMCAPGVKDPTCSSQC